MKLYIILLKALDSEAISTSTMSFTLYRQEVAIIFYPWFTKHGMINTGIQQHYPKNVLPKNTHPNP